MIKLSKQRWMEPLFRERILDEQENMYSSREVNEHFFNKCNFCETSYISAVLRVDNYRPIDGALNIVTGEFSEEHYRWLKNSWSNIMLICTECIRAKSNRFPLEGDFCDLSNAEHSIKSEKRLLINPFIDYPEKHFIYNEDGIVSPLSKKGEVTIDVLDLNRSSLIVGRSLALFEFEKVCNRFISDVKNNNLLWELSEYIDEDAQFSGIKRYFLKKMISSGKMPHKKELDPFIADKNHRIFYSENEERNEKNNEILIKNYLREKKKADYFDVSNDKNIKKYFSNQRFIETVEIKNFKGVKHVKLNLGISKSKDAPWLMILGENGVGKSSILQAISLGLMGSEKRNAILNKERYSITNNKADEGFIKIKLTGMLEPIVVIFDGQNNIRSGENHGNSLLLILSYGSTRLLSNSQRVDDFRPSWARVENLFDPFVTLVDAESYMLQLQEEDFIKVKTAIESLFTESVVVRRLNKRELKFDFTNSSVSLDELSDGYKTIIVLATDIMMVLKNRWRNYDAEGIVLIDELDAHLHPKWNIEIVSKLKKTFPKIQFIATTHNPLTLRGLLKDEIVVLKNNNEDSNEDFVQTLPFQKEMKIDEILTSKYFGLNDTQPELNRLFNEYYKLLINPELNEEQQSKVKRLKNELSHYEKVGTTRRDRLFYEAIDRYLALEKNDDGIDKLSFINDIDNIIKSLKGYYRT